MKSYCSTSIKSLDVKARREGNYPASNRMRLWATDFASEASFEKRRHSSQKQQVGAPAHYSSRHIDSVPKATLRKAWQELLFHGSCTDTRTWSFQSSFSWLTSEPFHQLSSHHPQELLFHGRLSFRSLLWTRCLQWFDAHNAVPLSLQKLLRREADQNTLQSSGIFKDYKFFAPTAATMDSAIARASTCWKDREECENVAHVALWARFASW